MDAIITCRQAVIVMDRTAAAMAAVLLEAAGASGHIAGTIKLFALTLGTIIVGRAFELVAKTAFDVFVIFWNDRHIFGVNWGFD